MQKTPRQRALRQLNKAILRKNRKIAWLKKELYKERNRNFQIELAMHNITSCVYIEPYGGWKYGLKDIMEKRKEEILNGEDRKQLLGKLCNEESLKGSYGENG